MKKVLILIGLFAVVIVAQSVYFALATAPFADGYVVNTLTGEATPPVKTGNATEAVLTKLCAQNVTSEAVCFNGSMTEVEELMKRLFVKPVKTETVGGSNIVYGYSSLLKGYRYVGGAKVNFMASINGTCVVVGTPLIEGAF